MRVFSLLAFLAMSAGLSTAALAQQMLAYGVATNFEANGRVLELDVPADADGLPFYAVWRTGKGQFSAQMQTRAGRHCYEMRNLPFWDGPVISIAITVPGIPGRVKTPTFSDEIDMFLEPEIIAPTTVNFVRGHGIFGRSANVLLLAILAVVAFCFARWRKMPAPLAITLGFLTAWGLASLMTVYDHVAIVRTMEKRGPGMFPLAGLPAFADRASEMIGGDSWGDDLTELYRDFLHYQLAEKRYVPATSRARPTFWITRNPGKDPILWQYANYYLVRKIQP